MGMYVCTRRHLLACVVAAGCAGASSAMADVVTLTPTADNTLYQDNTGSLSNGAGQHFFAGTNSGGKVRRGLLRFDVASSIPQDATITSVTLLLHVSRAAGGASMVAMHRTLSDWGEGTTDADGAEGGGGPATPDSATWLHAFYDQTLWTNPGGDFAPAASASLLVGDQGSYAWSSPELVADVQAWVDGTTPDFGWTILGDESTTSTAKRFDTRENGDTTVWPQLVVEYVPTPSTLALVPIALGFAARRKRPA